MLGPAVLAPPFSGRTRSGRGCRSTTTPTRARLHLPLSLSHQTRDREIRYELRAAELRQTDRETAGVLSSSLEKRDDAYFLVSVCAGNPNQTKEG
ncbi:hypothetical protein cypCar_00010847 [Cyprinus carpio]|nr:hypothetical protein cypCar_00010847 [Cyprinus carpio]